MSASRPWNDFATMTKILSLVIHFSSDYNFKMIICLKNKAEHNSNVKGEGHCKQYHWLSSFYWREEEILKIGSCDNGYGTKFVVEKKKNVQLTTIDVIPHRHVVSPVQ